MNPRNYRYQFVAGNLALDFINTVAFRLDPAKVRDHLQSAEEVRQWANQAHLSDRVAISSSPPLSKTALRRLRAVREQLFAVFRAIASDVSVPAVALRRISKALHDRSPYFCFVQFSPPMCRRRLRLAVFGPFQRSQKTLVQHGRLRQSKQSSGALSA
jgi:predicted RNA-binding Zn ribbon-like protein